MSSNALTVVPQYQDPQMLETIRQTVCKGATEAQFRMFIEVCKATGLNPFLKEIYYAPQIGVMASRDGYLRKANDHPQFDGMETRVERDDKNVPIKAVCSVWRKDRGHPVICEAYYSEYKKASQVWQQYPSAMIAKVAEVLALKRSFAINGVVTEEEIGEQGSKEAQQDYLRSKGIGIDADRGKVSPLPLAERSTVSSRSEQAVKSPSNTPDVRTASEQHKALIVETAKMLDEPPQTNLGIDAAHLPVQAERTVKSPITSIEMRHAATVAETDAVLKQVAKPPTQVKPKRITADSIEIRKGMTNMKEMLREASGDDSIYRQTLKAYGFESSKDIPTKEEGRVIYKAMGELLNRIRDEKKLRAELELAESVYASKFKGLLGYHGCESIDDVLNLSSEPLEALRKDIRALGGAA